MTPSRIPPPSADDIPRPVPGPDEPPRVEIDLDGVRYDDEVEVTEEDGFGPDEVTASERRCLRCGGEFVELDDSCQPPASREDAWGRYGGRCRGTKDPTLWDWCKGPIGEGRLEMPGQGLTVFFHDRRRGAVPVSPDRRRKT